MICVNGRLLLGVDSVILKEIADDLSDVREVSTDTGHCVILDIEYRAFRQFDLIVSKLTNLPRVRSAIRWLYTAHCHVESILHLLCTFQLLAVAWRGHNLTAICPELSIRCWRFEILLHGSAKIFRRILDGGFLAPLDPHPILGVHYGLLNEAARDFPCDGFILCEIPVVLYFLQHCEHLILQGFLGAFICCHIEHGLIGVLLQLRRHLYIFFLGIFQSLEHSAVPFLQSHPIMSQSLCTLCQLILVEMSDIDSAISLHSMLGVSHFALSVSLVIVLPVLALITLRLCIGAGRLDEADMTISPAADDEHCIVTINLKLG